MTLRWRLIDAVGCTKTANAGLRIEGSSSRVSNLKKKLWNPPEKVKLENSKTLINDNDEKFPQT
jgi:hypothetical protein